jgi:tetrapyrrole methylase family protein/MazG family protein
MPTPLFVVGLGPGNPDARTLGALDALAAAERIVLRTAVHPGVADIAADPRTITCDDLYEQLESFDQVYAAIAERVLTEATARATVFAIPGHPLVGERCTTMVLELARERGVETQVVPAVSALDAVAAPLNIDLIASQPQIIDATALCLWLDQDPFNGVLPDISPLRPALVTQVYSQRIAAATKTALNRVLPDDHEIVILTAAGVPGQERLERVPLYMLDRAIVDHLTTLWVPALETLDASRSPLTLHRIAAHLRSPMGCPWDRKQSHTSLRDPVLDEAYEVAEAIDGGNVHELAEELGDLLLLVAVQAQIAEEAGTFSIGDVFDHVNRKLVRRHPHVFGDRIAVTPDAVVQTWNEIKRAEKLDRGEATDSDGSDPLDRLPKSMPATRRVARTLAKNGITVPETNVETSIGRQLLAAVGRAVEAGLDPERELEAAYRQLRSGTVPAD